MGSVSGFFLLVLGEVLMMGLCWVGGGFVLHRFRQPCLMFMELCVLVGDAFSRVVVCFYNLMFS